MYYYTVNDLPPTYWCHSLDLFRPGGKSAARVLAARGRRWLDQGASAHNPALYRVAEGPLLVLCSGLQERKMAGRHHSNRRKQRNRKVATLPD